ncbi:LA2681 family HEPN domain-containing protein [Alteromonas stellipolaris]|uniref:LA2681-like HEPN domain-containing protein n=1 Tax=Alteromonas stellipolaris TaxID=233316 RepID=A0ABM5YQ80_9ALTE|nr:hypothetical protein AVL57_01040 [Alteromonas stellipolaris]
MDMKEEISIELHNEMSALMDELCDQNDFDGIIQLCEDLGAYTHDSSLIRLHLFYNIGSGYSHVAARREIQFDSKSSGLALLNYRKAMAEVKAFARECFRSVPSDEVMNYFYDLRSRILTNMANELDCQGRRLEALSYYDDSIEASNVHAMLSKARCLYQFAQDVYDDSHAYYLQRESFKCYKNALSRIDEFPLEQRNSIESNPFHNHFLNWFQEQEIQFGSEFPELNTLSGSSADTKKEKDYLIWCAEHRLFINELNGISTSEVVNHDVLSLPSFTARINTLLTTTEELSFHGHFDEMKTDYCYARYLAFMGSSIPLFEEHFFNSTFEHVDTLDYEINSLKTNHLKSCFRISYSIFDKISFLLHRFFELDTIQNDHQVDFKKVWFKPRSQELKSIFQSSGNDYFRALYFISREIRQGGRNTPDEQDPSYWFDPDTLRLFEIRNAMEHRAFKLVDAVCHSHHSKDNSNGIEECRSMILNVQQNIELISQQLLREQGKKDELENQLEKLRGQESSLVKDLDEKERMSSYFTIVGVEEFELLTMKLLTLAKDALVYLSLAIHYEESNKPQNGLVLPSFVPKK